MRHENVVQMKFRLVREDSVQHCGKGLEGVRYRINLRKYIDSHGNNV